MTYIRVRWLHEDSDEPILLYSELDADRWEIRKVEIYRDGPAGFADGVDRGGGSMLGELPVPDLAEIAASPEFEPEEIPRTEFERVWQDARVGLRQG